MAFAPAHGERAAVRMYCQGFGDCFLLVFQDDTGLSRILIDCGVVRNTPQERERMKAVVENVFEDTGGHLDALVVTHEHYDHVCGFIHAKERWEDFTIDELWLPWTEDLGNPKARDVAKYKKDAFGVLFQGTRGMNVSGEIGRNIESLLELLPAYSQTTGLALETIVEIAKRKGTAIKYLKPGMVESLRGAHAIALGPPENPARLRDLDGKSGDTFPSLAMTGFGAGAAEDDSYRRRLRQALGLGAERPTDYSNRLRQALGLRAVRSAATAPFSKMFLLKPTDAARWDAYAPGQSGTAGADRTDRLYDDPNAAWRRIDEADLGRFETLAMQLDSLTNNLSLAIAFVVDDKVLLFPGDAQIGNWKSWDGIECDIEGPTGSRTWTTETLMDAVRIYKVGHHASHNGTCRPNRFDRMPVGTRTLVSFEPVTRWPSIPATQLIEALEKKGPVARVDQANSAPSPFRVSPTTFAQRAPNLPNRPLYIEVGI